MTGLHDIDEYIQAQLLLAALSITTHVLQTGGTFVAKIFRGKDTTLLYSQLRIFFEKVSITKPASSRNSSIEAFVVCQEYRPPAGYVPQMINPMFDDVMIMANETESPVNRMVIPFIVCGDLRGFDSDMSYSLDVSASIAFFGNIFYSFLINQIDKDKGYTYQEVVQKPISPAYKEILEKTRTISLRHQSIVVEEGTDAAEEKSKDRKHSTTIEPVQKKICN